MLPVHEVCRRAAVRKIGRQIPAWGGRAPGGVLRRVQLVVFADCDDDFFRIQTHQSTSPRYLVHLSRSGHALFNAFQERFAA